MNGTPIEDENPYLKLLRPAIETAKNVGAETLGAVEAAANLGSQVYGLPAIGLAGVAGLPTGRSEEYMQKAGEATVYQPRTAAGKRWTEGAAVPFELLGRAAEKVADVAREYKPSQELSWLESAPWGGQGAPTEEQRAMAGTIAGTGTMALPFAFGARKIGKKAPVEYPKVPKGVQTGISTPNPYLEMMKSERGGASKIPSAGTGVISPDSFISARSKSSRPEFLTPYTSDELGNFQLYLKNNVGYALTPEMDLVNVFNNSGKKGEAVKAVTNAISRGAKTLDCFDGFLPKYYEQFGFKTIKREPWNDQFAPKNWGLTKYGKPDIVYMEYEGGRDAQYLRGLEESILGKRVQGKPEGTTTPAQVVSGVGTGERAGVPQVQSSIAPQPVGTHPERPALISPLSSTAKSILKSEKGAIGEPPAFGWYSPLQRTIESKMGNAAPVEQVRSLIKSAGVKDDEIKWSGLDDYLEGKTKVGKKELMDYLKENQVEVKEIVKSGKKFSTTGPRSERVTGDEPKFSQWQLPGGENYREVLMQLPEKQKVRNKYIRKTEGQRPWKVFVAEEKEHQASFKTESEANEFMSKHPTFSEKVGQPFTGSHWDEPNILAHLRMNDRVDASGKKVLFIEEVQSDWHQAGREQGYGNKSIHYEVKPDKATTGWYHVLEDGVERPEVFTSIDRANAFVEFATTLDQNKEFVPRAPFSKTWHEMAMRRAVREAAEKGYEKVAWTTGEQQAERYDLSKHISNIDWIRDDVNKTVGIAANDLSGAEVINKEVPRDKLTDTVGKELAKKILESTEEEGTFKGLDLKVGGEGMKGFYDKMIVDYMNKFGKKWGVKVEETKFPAGLAQPTYKGPPWSDTISKKLNDFAWNEKYDATTNSTARGVINIMTERGMGFKEAMEAHGNAYLAEKLGGTLEWGKEFATVHSLPITPEMKASIKREGLPLFTLAPLLAGSTVATYGIARKQKEEAK